LPWSSDNRPIIVPPSTESLGKRNHDLRNRSTGVYQQYPPLADIFETFEGTIESAIDLDWAPGSLGGQAEIELVDLSLETDVVAVMGLQGRVRIDSLTPLGVTRTQSLRAREVVSALPLSNPLLSFRLHQKPGETEAVLHVDRFETEIAGGRLSPAPCSTRLRKTSPSTSVSRMSISVKSWRSST